MAVRKTPITLLNRLIFMAMSFGLATLAQAIIDVDGDGFACKWDPEIYRKINSLSENKEPSN